jgi:hypothetical protein
MCKKVAQGKRKSRFEIRDFEDRPAVIQSFRLSGHAGVDVLGSGRWEGWRVRFPASEEWCHFFFFFFSSHASYFHLSSFPLFIFSKHITHKQCGFLQDDVS